ncbi:MAG: cytochrome c biogenesis heme-transporting ATPase CcmA [Rhodocyclaceae bacterium]|nr:cytochrome c biogenesis heme-transporting ATPase CcmA [Rhodocyclaceae bacterium]
MLQVTDLACMRGDRLLFHGVNLTLEPGQMLRLGGPNGIGKTSMLRILCALVHPEHGQITWHGDDILKEREAFHGDVLYLGHASNLSELLTPLENLGLMARIACHAQSDAASVEQALVRIGLGERLDLPCKVLSAGQRRRVGLARLFLASDKPVWILDEPFSALDVNAVAELAETLDEHCERGGIVIYTTHQEVAFRTPVRTIDLAEYAA